MSSDEVGETIKKADRERDKALIAIFYITGARVSEIIDLKREDFTIRSDELLITIEPQKRSDSGSPLRKYDNLIFDRERTPFIDIILDYVSDLEEDEFLFSSREGGHISRVRAWQIAKEINPESSPHFYRHTRLSRMKKRGATLDDLRKFSGRQTPPVKYMETSEEEMRELGRMID